MPSTINNNDLAAKQIWIDNKLQEFINQGFITSKYVPNSARSILVIKGKNYAYSPCYIQALDSLIALSDYFNFRKTELQKLENKGFPFASYTLVFNKHIQDTFFFDANINYGEFWRYDSIAFLGFNLAPTLLKWIAKIKPQNLYNLQANEQLLYKISAIDGFAAMPKPIEFAIVNNKNTTILPIKQFSQDYVSGIIGLNSTADGRRNLTGEFESRFNNILELGSQFYLQWQSFQARSQSLRTHFTIPYVLGTPIIYKISYSLDKLDSIYSTSTRALQLRFPFKQGFSMAAEFQKTNRNRITTDENLVRITKQLPNNPTSINVLYGLSFNYLQGDPSFTAIKQFSFQLQSFAGTRNFVKDAKIAQIYWINSLGNSENVYDSLQRVGQFSANQYSLQSKFNWHVPISKLFVFRSFASAQILFLPTIYFNELSRFGGINSLIGFNEQSIFANKFTSFGTETRIMLNSNGYVGLIYNGALAINQSNTNPSKNWLHGAGITGVLQTRAGLLQLAWALGAGAGNSFGLNQSKFHFGLISNLGK